MDWIYIQTKLLESEGSESSEGIIDNTPSEINIQWCCDSSIMTNLGLNYLEDSNKEPQYNTG